MSRVAESELPPTQDLRLELSELPEPVLDSLAEQHAEYVRLYKAGRVAQRENALGTVEALGAVQRAPIGDKEGRPIFLFYPSRLAAGERQGVSLEQVMSHALLLMHEHVVGAGGAYTVVWVCNRLEPDRLGYWWFRSTYRMVPDAYRKNMRSLCVVHPTLSTRATLLLLSYMLRSSFWEKLLYADRVEFLDDIMEWKAMDLPADLLDFDTFLDREMQLSGQQELSGLGGGSAFSAGYGVGGFGLTGEPLGSTHQSRFEEWRREKAMRSGAGSSAAPRPYNRDFNRDDEEVESEDEEVDCSRLVDVTDERAAPQAAHAARAGAAARGAPASSARPVSAREGEGEEGDSGQR